MKEATDKWEILLLQWMPSNIVQMKTATVVCMYGSEWAKSLPAQWHSLMGNSGANKILAESTTDRITFYLHESSH